MIAGASEKYAGLFYDKGAAAVNVMHPDFGVVGDGVADDLPALQSALNFATLIGASCYVPEGDYRLSDSLLLPSNCFLDMAPTALLLRNRDGGTHTAATIRNENQTTGNVNIRVRGGNLRNLTDDDTGKHLGFYKVTGFVLEGITFSGVKEDWNTIIRRCASGIIRGLYIDSGTGVGEDGIHIMSSRDIVVDNCYVSSGDDPLSFTSEDGETEDLTDVAVSNCVLIGRVAACVKFQAINDGSTGKIKRVTISNCVGRQLGTSGSVSTVITIRDQDGVAGSERIEDITISDSVFDAALVSSVECCTIGYAKRVTLNNVRILNCPSRPYYLDHTVDCQVINGTSTMSVTTGSFPHLAVIGGSGLRIRGGYFQGAGGSFQFFVDAGPSDILFEGCKLVSSAGVTTAILIDEGTDITVRDVDVDASLNTAGGVRVDGGTRITLERVRVKESYARGFSINAGDRVKVIDCESVNPRGAGAQGIYLDGIADAIVRGFSSVGATTHGIDLDSGCVGCMIENCDLRDSASAGIYLTDASYTTVLGNRCVGNDVGIAEPSPSDHNLIVANNARGNDSTAISTTGGSTTAANNLV